jgi:hypothetical protein
MPLINILPFFEFNVNSLKQQLLMFNPFSFFKLFNAFSKPSFLFFAQHIIASSKARTKFVHLSTKSLGVRFFIVKGRLFLDLGYSHYCVIKIPAGVTLHAKKKNLYLLSIYDSLLTSFLYLILRLKRFSVYKSKGLIPFSRIKYIRLKLGKKQQI